MQLLYLFRRYARTLYALGTNYSILAYNKKLFASIIIRGIIVKDCNRTSDCRGRREFLVKTAGLAGGLVLTLSGFGSAFGNTFADVTVTIDSASPLNKVGGSVVVDSSAGKIIIARTGDATFIAYSAKCTHKGGLVEFDAASKQFVCPKHGSKFDAANGNVTDGPADTKLASFPANGTASSVTITVS